tara:strand:+ start:40 stop:450 length:411 start_codon:yes stop_codon:yes gene_type:complete
MLILCSSCKSKYLVNSADLKPNGRNVQCAKCGHNWYQTAEIDDINPPLPLNEDQKNKNINKTTANLPSTYIKEQKPSILNSFLVVVFIVALVVLFWLFKNSGISLFVLIKFYILEFYFNLKLIISDLAKLIYHVIN